ncbi:hypothetical protein M0804_002341 [Polistes exclamans]|nr:hypothetical protein M0804_002341 [Polistes exclamans]
MEGVGYERREEDDNENGKRSEGDRWGFGGGFGGDVKFQHRRMFLPGPMVNLIERIFRVTMRAARSAAAAAAAAAASQSGWLYRMVKFAFLTRLVDSYLLSLMSASGETHCRGGGIV